MTNDSFVLVIAAAAAAPPAVDALARFGLAPVWQGRGGTLLTGPYCLHATFDDAPGVIVGTVFDWTSRAPLQGFDRSAADAIILSRGLDLITRYWGGYIAVFETDAELHIIRDPSGCVPCYWVEDADRVLITSDPALCIDAGLVRPEIDWISVAGHLLHVERRSRATGLKRINEVMPGERLTIGSGATTITPLWEPWPFTRPERAISTEAEAIELVGRAVRNCVGAWGRRFDRPLVSLSGGLDSSVMAAALARQSPICVTIATHEPAGDERSFARQVADRIGSPLVERFFALEHIDITRSAAARLPRPVSRIFAQELDRIWRETIVTTHADALFHGGGGDNVFCYLTSPAPVLDALRVAGFGGTTLRALTDIAKLTGASWPAVARGVLRKIVIDRGRYRWQVDRTGLSERAISLGAASPHHPWFAAEPRDILPGKQAHVAAIVRIQNHLDAAEPTRAVPVIAPLLSQPIVETCLRVPSWMWCAGGINRSIVRQAFAADLPPTIVGRRDKGTPDAFDASIVQSKRAEIATMLSDGLLAKNEMLDRRWIARALADEGPIRGSAYLRIAMFVDVEAWLQSWAGIAGTGDGGTGDGGKADLD